MDETISRGVVSGGRVKDRGESTFSRDHTVVPPVPDRYNLVYISMVLAGTGFLLPYNSFVSAVDFYKVMFPGSSIMFDISLVYILTALLAVLLNNIFIDTFTLNSRIRFGYFLAIVTLGLVVLCNSMSSSIGRNQLYATTLTAVAAVSLGSTVQQSSFYGYTSMLPTRYTQAVMLGESMAGVLSSMFRILTKMLVKEETYSTTIFFLISLLILILCLTLFPKVQRSEFVSFYISMALKSQEKTEERRLGSDESMYGKPFLPITESLIPDDDESFQIPEFGPNCRSQYRMRERLEDGLVEVEVEGKKIGGNIFKCFRGLHGGLKVRLAVCSKIVPHMLGIGLTYAVTLSLFPGIESEISSCRFGDWMPVFLIAAFNISDLLGKVLAGLHENWSRAEMVLWPFSRILLIPLLVICATPRHKPIISEGEEWYFMTICTFIGSIVREHSGNLMTISYSVGLTIGSLFAYWLDYIIGVGQGPVCPRTLPSSGHFFNSTAATTVSGFKI
ncbi:equilibrative nucleoside transporter 4 [Eurytemora carolleeae]|uniref:equilibrative nucleoside transporter 4 n=1 Tax=Eurytemora carolleeae TaxID=1294199 RepID=UPI000C780596|nr:equilibrative nucleoside transporter 4 [Eurytemora carolleeae]|eukprot:XP_023327092.1 equilibrative nucleoside transporter 4-like [Eurytemora affinis]